MRTLRWFSAGMVLLATVPQWAIEAQHTVVAINPTSEAKAWVPVMFNRPVTLQLDRVPLKRAINVLATIADVRINYQGTLLDAVIAPVTVHATRLPLGEVLEHLLRGTGLQAVLFARGQISIEPVSEQGSKVQGIVTGRVTDAKTLEALVGVTVLLDDATHGVQTNETGMFRILGISPGSHVVKARRVGYMRKAQTVQVIDGQTVTTDFALSQSVNALDQVVVTGTVVQTELKAVPNAITMITAKDIEQRGITKIDQLFRGDVPGLFAPIQGSGALLDEVVTFSRGATALSNASIGISKTADAGDILTNVIKTYVDGVELADPKYLSQIDPKSIERIEILTGPQASTIYGSNALNGVMQVFTKRGTSNAPQLTLNLLSGWVENNFSAAHTPQHDYSAQLNGIEGRLSYNAGGSWNYVGPWTPAKQTTRTSAFGSTRLTLSTPVGQVTADMTLRRIITQNWQRGVTFQTQAGYQETGWWAAGSANSVSRPTTQTLTGQTLGVTLGYALTNWWSHEFGVGQDASDTEVRSTARGYQSSSDTTLQFEQRHTDRRSLRYTTTVRAPMTSLVHTTVTIGADAWQSLTDRVSVQPQTLTGSLTNVNFVIRQPDHNTGAFLQTQLEMNDEFFLTYGLRAEWNPAFGEQVQPSYAPRYGVAYTRTLLGLTAKLRASYGRSTRPPQATLKAEVTATNAGWSFAVPAYGNFALFLANPELAPEHQQGGEGGIELYWNTHGSLVVTRYNQTVDGLIASPIADSTRSLAPNPIVFGLTCAQLISFGASALCSSQDAAGFGYVPQYRYSNIGSIRNQGWELQGSMNAGPFTTKGTYSWTKSRTIGVNPQYRAFFTPASYPQYQPGATFQYLPEHTWAFGMTYARAATMAGFNVTGIGRLTNTQDNFYLHSLISSIRLPQNRLRMTSTGYVYSSRGNALMDITAAQQFTARVEGVLQVQNLTDRFVNDQYASDATMGRQAKAGLRLKLQ